MCPNIRFLSWKKAYFRPEQNEQGCRLHHLLHEVIVIGIMRKKNERHPWLLIKNTHGVGFGRRGHVWLELNGNPFGIMNVVTTVQAKPLTANDIRALYTWKSPRDAPNFVSASMTAGVISFVISIGPLALSVVHLSCMIKYSQESADASSEDQSELVREESVGEDETSHEEDVTDDHADSHCDGDVNLCGENDGTSEGTN